MSHPSALRIPLRNIVALILTLVFALFLRTYLRLELIALGFQSDTAGDLSYLLVVPVIVLMLLPLVWNYREFLFRLLNRRHLTLRLILSAIATGILMRLIWWSQLIVRVSFGFPRNSDPDAVVGPVFAFACPPPHIISLGVLVMAILVPIIEEFLHRGVIQTAFMHKGRTHAILVSAVVFTLFHPPSSYAFVFVMGIVFGLQYWKTQTLWASMITHATYNGLIQLDWRCLHGTWNPTPEQLPAEGPGLVAIGILIVASACVIWLLTCISAGAPSTPRHS